MVEVETAIPAFIGYTEKADDQGISLINKPWRITSMTQFVECFGGPPKASFNLINVAPLVSTLPDFSILVPSTANGEKMDFWLQQDSGAYLLYYSMQLFFDNGGGACYIVAVGNYSDRLDADKLINGLQTLKKEPEATILVVPEAVLLTGTLNEPSSACTAVQKSVIDHCGVVMRNRFAILDIYDGYLARSDAQGDCIAKFREALDSSTLNFAAAYYPWVDTTIVQAEDFSYLNIKNPEALQKLLIADMMLDPSLSPTDPVSKKTFDDKTQAVANITLQWGIDGVKFKTADDIDQAKLALNQLLNKFSPLYGAVKTALAKKLNRLPPSAAIAGLYASVDKAYGVWKAPANIKLTSVLAPTVPISDEEQNDLNVPTSGKSINALRAFVSPGVLVWGARTLDGNSLDWSHVNVRRTLIMLEESLRLTLSGYVFEPNGANTWITVKSMISNFLEDVWQRGGLAGATPADAFSVQVGVGETMTGDDILEGYMRVSVLVALTMPAEFIEFTFSMQMTES